MTTIQSRRASLLVLLIAACDGGSGDARGTTLARSANVPAGANCALGGIVITTGPDNNGDGLLDDSEVTATQYICKESAKTVIVTTPEGFGTHCPAGGNRLDAGTDTNGNGTLDASEVSSTQYVCFDDVFADRAYEPVLIATAQDLAAFRGTTIAYRGVTLELDGSLADVTLPSLQFNRGDLSIHCTTSAATTVHLPLLERIDGSITLSGDCYGVVFEAPLLESVGLDLVIDSVFAATVSLPKLSSLRNLRMVFSRLAALPDLPGLTRLESITTNANTGFDTCSTYRLAAQLQRFGATPIITNDNAAPCTDSDALCPTLVIEGSSEQVRVCFNALDWDGARSLCQSFGGPWDLAYIRGDLEVTALSSVPSLFPADFWLGYSDDSARIDGATEGTFAWVQNVDDNTYAPQGPGVDGDQFWALGQPDNGGAGAPENCAAVRDSNGSLHVSDEDCASSRRPLCRALQ